MRCVCTDFSSRLSASFRCASALVKSRVFSDSSARLMWYPARASRTGRAASKPAAASAISFWRRAATAMTWSASRWFGSFSRIPPASSRASSSLPASR